MKSLYATNFERRTAGGGHEEITGRRNGTISGWLAEVKKYTDCCEGMLPYEAYASEGESIPLDESSGRIAAATVTPYPPGVPVLYPGEIISRNHIVYIREILDAGGKVNGIDKNIIKIVK
jgi:arginine decarboxylase